MAGAWCLAQFRLSWRPVELRCWQLASISRGWRPLVGRARRRVRRTKNSGMAKPPHDACVAGQCATRPATQQRRPGAQPLSRRRPTAAAIEPIAGATTARAGGRSPHVAARKPGWALCCAGEAVGAPSFIVNAMGPRAAYLQGAVELAVSDRKSWRRLMWRATANDWS